MLCGSSSPFVENGNNKLSFLLADCYLIYWYLCIVVFGFVIYRLCVSIFNAFGCLLLVHVLEKQFSGLLYLFIYCTSFELFKALKISICVF